MIIPKEHRISVYSVFDNYIINELQKQSYPAHFQVNNTDIEVARKKCCDTMTNDNNLRSFVYVHQNGAVEIEINVKKPQYKFHPNYQ